MPGAFEGETVTRRNFMAAVTHGSGGIAAMAFTLPALGFARSSAGSRSTGR
jgi:menaquinol-cytochrome c reductase iron-sulfur subunit